MRVFVGIVGGVLVVLMLAEFFVSFLLPRRVKRDPRIARAVLRFGWRGWRGVARRLPPVAADTMLGLYGPLGLLGLLAFWRASASSAKGTCAPIWSSTSGVPTPSSTRCFRATSPSPNA